MIVSVFIFSRLPIVNKADIIRSFLTEINRFKICMRSNHTRSDIQSFIFSVVNGKAYLTNDPFVHLMQ